MVQNFVNMNRVLGGSSRRHAGKAIATDGAEKTGRSVFAKAGLAAAYSGGAGKRPGCKWCGRCRSGKEKGNEAKPEYAPGLSRY